MSEKVNKLRVSMIFLFIALTLTCAISTLYFAINGDAYQRNVSAISSLVGMFLVDRLIKDHKAEKK